jgi:hypothetical protein
MSESILYVNIFMSDLYYKYSASLLCATSVDFLYAFVEKWALVCQSGTPFMKEILFDVSIDIYI